MCRRTSDGIQLMLWGWAWEKYHMGLSPFSLYGLEILKLGQAGYEEELRSQKLIL